MLVRAPLNNVKSDLKRFLSPKSTFFTAIGECVYYYTFHMAVSYCCYGGAAGALEQRAREELRRGISPAGVQRQVIRTVLNNYLGLSIVFSVELFLKRILSLFSFIRLAFSKATL